MEGEAKKKQRKKRKASDEGGGSSIVQQQQQHSLPGLMLFDGAFIVQQQQQQQQQSQPASSDDAEACWLNSKYEIVVRKLQLEYDAGIKLLYTQHGVLKCIYLTTPAMQQAFNAIPQFLCIETDLSFRSSVMGQTNSVKQKVCLMLAEDGNGKSVIVSAGISTIGDNTRWLFDTFKSCNPAWKQVRCILADPGPTSDVIKKAFLGVHVCCNSWQAAKFSSKYSTSPVSAEKINSYINQFFEDKDTQLPLINSLIGSQALSKILELIDRQNHTNLLHNDLEKILKKFEPLDSSANLQPEDFLAFFFEVVAAVERERKEFALSRLQKAVLSKQSPTDTLTKHASNLIDQQTLLAREMMRLSNGAQSQEFAEYSTSTQKCQCLFGKIFRLPCRHVLMLTSELRVKSHIPFELRWTVYHCLFGCNIEANTETPSEPIEQKQRQQDLPQQHPQVIFCNAQGLHFVKEESTTQAV